MEMRDKREEMRQEKGNRRGVGEERKTDTFILSRPLEKTHMFMNVQTLTT